MSEEVQLLIRGTPRPLSRTGHGQMGGRYLTAPTSRQIGLVVDAWERAGEPRFDDDLALELHARFYFERPKAHYGSGQRAREVKERFRTARPTGRPDVDNLAKLICEALQGNAFRDDSRVVQLYAAKFYAPDFPAYTEVRVRPAAEERPPGYREFLEGAAA